MRARQQHDDDAIDNLCDAWRILDAQLDYDTPPGPSPEMLTFMSGILFSIGCLNAPYERGLSLMDLAHLGGTVVQGRVAVDWMQQEQRQERER